jgi:lysophospholipase L1-like esterase/dienelactone hydrolase
MNRRIILFAFLLSIFTVHAQQKVIQLYNGPAPGSENWNWDEKEKDYDQMHLKIVYNVSRPTLTVFLPDSSIATGAAVIVCPGGGFQFLSIESEGYDVARWLNKKGVAAFVLKYRLTHSLTDDPFTEFISKQPNTEKFNEEIKPVVAMEIADGKTAVTYVRSHAAEYNLSPDHIGIMGFSAGGTLATGVAYNYDANNRPDFVAPVYPYIGSFTKGPVPDDAPPVFIVAASDDQFGFNIHCIDLYKDWVTSKHSAELHIYAKGGHGFGMRRQDIPTDTWIERFGDWLQLQGFAKAGSPNAQQVAGMQKMLSDWPNLHRYENDNEKLEPASNEKRIVFMGNSITEGWIRTDSAFFADNPYVDRGISGQTTPQMLLRFRQDVINLKPAVVVILAGINDIAQNTGVMTLEQTYGNIVSMAELAKTNNIHVVISSVLPAFDFPWHRGLEPAEKVVKLNSMLKNYANKNNIVYVDYFSAMGDSRKGLPESLSKDGVHPNLTGYKVMEPLVQKAIAEAIRKK